MQDEFNIFIYIQILISDVDKVRSSSPVCGKSFKNLYGSKSVTLNDKEVSTSEILTPAFVPVRHRNRKLPCDTTFKSANLKNEGVSDIQEYTKELY
jgi:hypothetical protein